MRCGILIGSAMGGMKTFSTAIEALHKQARKICQTLQHLICSQAWFNTVLCLGGTLPWDEHRVRVSAALY